MSRKVSGGGGSPGRITRTEARSLGTERLYAERVEFLEHARRPGSVGPASRDPEPRPPRLLRHHRRAAHGDRITEHATAASRHRARRVIGPGAILFFATSLAFHSAATPAAVITLMIGIGVGASLMSTPASVHV